VNNAPVYLVLGANGLLGRHIVAQLALRQANYVTAARTLADHCLDFIDLNAVDKLINQVRPDIVINCAALVDLAQCEKQPGLAYQVNTALVGQLVNSCKGSGCYLVQISTDHYYNEIKDVCKAHNEQDNVTLINQYASTKYLAECLTANHARHLIIRTNFVGFRSMDRPSFLDWLFRELSLEHTINGFDNFWVSSLDVNSLACHTLQAIDGNLQGLYNIASSSVFSKYEFICSFANSAGFCDRLVIPTRYSDKYRNLSLGLDVSKIQNALGITMPSLADVINNLVLQMKAKP
jgi:dTDP-4-dehydrorhamnose reductase